MEQRKLDRISELTRISRERDLTPEETKEREALRREYIEAYKQSLISQLENLTIIEPDGTKRKPTLKQ